MTARFQAGLLLVVALIGCACEQAPGHSMVGVAEASPRADSATRWPSEPKGFVVWTDQPWDGIAPTPAEDRIARMVTRARALLAPAPPADGRSWRYLRRSSSKDDAVVPDATAPFSGPNVLRIVFTPDMKRDHEPSVHFIGLPRPVEIFAGWWVKLSPNWTCRPGCGKMTFLFPDHANAGVTYSNLGGRDGSRHVNVATTWPSTGYKFWEPNLTKTAIETDRWYRVEWYVKWASHADARDGVIRWWVDGVLNGEYRDVPFPALPGFIEFQHAPTRQDPPPAEEFMYIDHTYVSLALQQ